MRLSPALDGLPLGRKLLAHGAVAVADAIAVLAVRGRATGDRRLLVSVANLGDQLRFMNVWSRFTSLGATFDVACNAPTKEAFELYDCVGDVVEFGRQGVASLASSAMAMLAREKRYASAFVPQPFFSRPIAMAYARTHAASVIAVDGRGSPGDVRVALDSRSWQAAYEQLARAAVDASGATASPRLRASLGLAWHGRRSQGIALHPATSAPSRTLPADRFREIAARIIDLGFAVTALGGPSEEPMLREMFAGHGVSFVCGAPLREVAGLLAGSAAFVGIDSSMMQLADAIGVPSAVIYTATSPGVAGPFYAKRVAVIPSALYRPASVEPEASWRGSPDAGSYVDVDEVIAGVVRLTG